MKHDSEWNPSHGIRLECACIVILNALGYIGFKVKTLYSQVRLINKLRTLHLQVLNLHFMESKLVELSFVGICWWALKFSWGYGKLN